MKVERAKAEQERIATAVLMRTQQSQNKIKQKGGVMAAALMTISGSNKTE